MQNKKKIIITVSRLFPGTHSRRGEPTDFAAKLEAGVKKHTIRKNADLWEHAASKMQGGKFRLCIRQWSGRPYKSKQVEIASRDEPIGTERITLTYNGGTGLLEANVNGTEVDVMELAKNDGLSYDDFKEWFFGQSTPEDGAEYQGVIIHFTKMRYSPNSAS